jgi:hypothetical protein
MTDLSRLLRDALPSDPPPLDLPEVVARSRQLNNRRRVGAAAGTALALAAAAVVVTAALPTSERDSLGPAGRRSPPAPTAAAAGGVVQLHFTSGCGDISPVQRRVEVPLLEASLRALFAGPTAKEQAGGAESTFGPATAGLLRSVRAANGSAYVDLDGALRDSVPKGPEGTGCSNFAEQVGGTLRQFGGIGAVYFAYDGDPADFVASFGGTCPAPVEPGGLCDPAPFRSPEAASDGEARRLIDAIRAFAAAPGPDTAAAVPLADQVRLGLGPDLLITRTREQLAQPRLWVLDRDDYAGYTGPFNPLDQLRKQGPHTAVTGSHPHCAGKPRPAPAELSSARRVSTQPASQTCLDWYSVDLFVQDGLVVAVTLDLFEP